MNESANLDPTLADGPVKCLLVDDVADNLTVLSALLAQDGVELFRATSGREALELVLLHDFALAILDVQMPEMDGFELAELMRGSVRARNVPIIFVTAGLRDPQRVFKGYDSGAVDFLHKPVDAHLMRSKAQVFFELFRHRQRLARELAERTETLRLNEMFVAVLGHDLRSPLSAIVTGASILKRHADPHVAQLSARILGSSLRMSRMIDDVLDLARVRLGGGMQLRREPVDLGALLERVVEEHGREGAQLELTALGDLRGAWDADRMAQVASNLVGNALEHGESAAPVRITVDGRRPDVVDLSVANAGSIPGEILPHIFDPFRSARDDARRRDGLGLGLYIVQQIVHAHSGRIEVRHPEPNLVEFRVAVPRSTDA